MRCAGSSVLRAPSFRGFSKDGEALQFALFRPGAAASEARARCSKGAFHSATIHGVFGPDRKRVGCPFCQASKALPQQVEAKLPDGTGIRCIACKPAKWLVDAPRPLLCNVPANADLVQSKYEDDLPANFACAAQLRGKRSVFVHAINDDYFALLNNPARIRFFRDAMSAVVRDKTVLDLGTGAGQLAVLAAQLGAKHVLAMDACSEMCALAKESAKRNQVTDTVQVAHHLSSGILFPEDDRVDVMVFEPYDVFITGQGSGSLEYVRDARRRLTKQNATLIPSSGAQYARLLMSADLGMRSVSDVSSSKVGLDNLSAYLDTATLNSSRTKGFRWTSLPDLKLLSERVCIFTLDFYNLQRGSIPRKVVAEVEVLHDGYVDAIATSWEARGMPRNLRPVGQ